MGVRRTYAPRGLKGGAIRQHSQHRCRGSLIDYQAQQLERGGIHPLQILPHGEYGLPLSFLGKPGKQRFLSFVLLLLGVKCERAPGSCNGMNSSSANSGKVSALGKRYDSSMRQGGQLGLRWVVAVYLEQLLQVGNHRVERTVDMVRRTAERNLAYAAPG